MSINTELNALIAKRKEIEGDKHSERNTGKNPCFGLQ
jgi:hypothetical protein